MLGVNHYGDFGIPFWYDLVKFRIKDPRRPTGQPACHCDSTLLQESYRRFFFIYSLRFAMDK